MHLMLPLVCALLTAPPAQDSTSAQLLQEVRRLREAIETMVSTGARVQIVFGRLQLQEQRTATAARRLDELREQLTRASNETAAISAQIADIEERLRDFRGTAEERSNFESEIQHMKRAAMQRESDRQRLQSEEAQAASLLATEQGRWGDLNQQLEELERSLAKRQD
jgi:predicted  nucleic acid-binding Zn-ribbon protein